MSERAHEQSGNARDWRYAFVEQKSVGKRPAYNTGRAPSRYLWTPPGEDRNNLRTNADYTRSWLRRNETGNPTCNYQDGPRTYANTRLWYLPTHDAHSNDYPSSYSLTGERLADNDNLNQEPPSFLNLGNHFYKCTLFSKLSRKKENREIYRASSEKSGSLIFPETRHKVYNSGFLFQFCKFCTFLRCNKRS